MQISTLILLLNYTTIKIDDTQFTMRYQNFVLRFYRPVDLKHSYYILSLQTSKLMAGVNIVSQKMEKPQ
jgi:hypothetical protein